MWQYGALLSPIQSAHLGDLHGQIFLMENPIQGRISPENLMMMKVSCPQGMGQAMMLCRVARYGVSQMTIATLSVRQEVRVNSLEKFYLVGRIRPNKRK